MLGPCGLSEVCMAMLAGDSQCELPVVWLSLVPGMRRKPVQPRHTEGGGDCRDIRSEVWAVARSRSILTATGSQQGGREA